MAAIRRRCNRPNRLPVLCIPHRPPPAIPLSSNHWTKIQFLDSLYHTVAPWFFHLANHCSRTVRSICHTNKPPDWLCGNFIFDIVSEAYCPKGKWLKSSFMAIDKCIVLYLFIYWRHFHDDIESFLFYWFGKQWILTRVPIILKQTDNRSLSLQRQVAENRNSPAMRIPKGI